MRAVTVAVAMMMLANLIVCIFEPCAMPSEDRTRVRSGISYVPPAPSYVGKMPVGEDRVTRVLKTVSGTAKVLVIMVDFSDTPANAAHDDAYYRELLFNDQNNRSMRRYFQENSYGKFDVVGATGGQWFHDANTSAFYGADSAGGIDDANGPIYNLVTSAVTLASPYVDFSNYDANSDGVVDHLVIVHAGNDQAESGNSDDIWSHAWYDYDEPTFNGVKIGPYTMLSENDAMGTYAHEFAHDLGLPDLYDYGYDSDGVGIWSLMAYGSFFDNGACPSHLDAWCKYRLGWVDVIDVDSTMKNITLPQVEMNGTASVYRLWVGAQDSSKEYFLVENRQKVGFDSFLPGSGLLIWHIDENMPNNNDQAHKLVDLEEASGTQHLDVADDFNLGDEYDPWYNNLIGFCGASSPNSNDYSGEPTGWGITNISSSSDNMTFNIQGIFDDVAIENIITFYNYIEEKKESQFWVRTGNRGRSVENGLVLTVSISIDDGAEIMNVTTTIPTLGVWKSNLTEWKWTPPITGKYHIRATVKADGDELLANNAKAIEVRAVRILFEDHVFEPAMTETNWTHGATTSVGIPAPYTDLWHIVTSGIGYGDSHSPLHSWWCGYETTGNYQRSHYYYLESKTLDLRDANDAFLLFYQKYDISAGFIGLFKDQALIEYRVGATQGELAVASWVQIGNYSGSSPLWTEELFDISICAGSYAQVRFRLYSNFLLLAGGWYVDDVIVFGQTQVRGVDVSSGGKEVMPGETTQILANISNLGNLRDTFGITLSTMPAGWSASIAPSTSQVMLTPLSSGIITIEVSVASYALAGDVVNLTITAISSNASGVRDSATASFVVGQMYGILLECMDGNVSVDPGTTATFSINVTNLGNGNDTLSFNLSGNQNAALDLSSITGVFGNNVEMPPFSTVVVIITLPVPAMSTSDCILGLNFSATSESGITEGPIMLFVKVNVQRALSIACKTPVQFALPGGSAAYTVNVSNNGNCQESIVLVYNSSSAYLVSGSLAIVLSPWTSMDVLVTVFATSDTPITRHDIPIRATSGNVTSGFATMALQIIAPDLKIGSITFSDEHPTAGQKVKVYVSVFNNGTADADGVTVEVFAAQVRFGTYSEGGINRNQWHQYTCTWNAKSGYVKISASASSTIRDIDDKDNTLEREIQVKAKSASTIDPCMIWAFVLIGIIVVALVVFMYSRKADEEYDIEVGEIVEEPPKAHAVATPQKMAQSKSETKAPSKPEMAAKPATPVKTTTTKETPKTAPKPECPTKPETPVKTTKAKETPKNASKPECPAKPETPEKTTKAKETPKTASKPECPAKPSKTKAPQKNDGLKPEDKALLQGAVQKAKDYDSKKQGFE